MRARWSRRPSITTGSSVWPRSAPSSGWTGNASVPGEIVHPPTSAGARSGLLGCLGEHRAHEGTDVPAAAAGTGRFRPVVLADGHGGRELLPARITVVLVKRHGLLLPTLGGKGGMFPGRFRPPAT